MIFRRQFNPNYKPSKGEKTDPISLTTPDMSLTVRELLVNHSRGIGVNVKDYGQDNYFDTEIPVFQDLNDVKEYREHLVEIIKQVENEIKKKKDADLLDKQNQDAKDKDAVSLVSEPAPNKSSQ